MNDSSLNGFKGYFKKIFLGLLGFIALFFLLTSVFAAVLTYVDLPDSAVTVMSMVIIAISNIVGAFIASKLNGKFGAIIGAIFGLLTFFIITAISLAVSQDSVTIMTLLKAIISVICAVLGGILGVNLQPKRKII